MSQETIDRLKALLFEKESRDLDQLARQLDAAVTDAQQHRGELSRRLDAIADRVGGDAQLRQSVARIVDQAIADAEETRNKELTRAMSPMVVRTFRAELAAKQTQDELAGMLYPRIGDMVRRFVSDAMRDLLDRINRGLEQNRLVLRLRALVTGRTMAELAVADSERLEIEEIYLIRRGSGELVHHWSQEAGPDGSAATAASNRDTLVSGFLTALTSFVEEAFEADKAKLRSIDLHSPDLEDRRIYLAGSPSLLMALKCKGSAQKAVERLLDGELGSVLAGHQQVEDERARAATPAADEAAAREHETTLLALSGRLADGIAEREREIRKARALRPLKLFFWLFLLPVALFLAWLWWEDRQSRLLQERLNAEIERTQEVKGYTVRARVDDSRGEIWVGGLVPDARARDAVLTRIRSALPEGMPLNDESLRLLPREDVDAALKAAGLSRSLERAGLKLDQLAGDLGRLASKLTAPEDLAIVEAARRAAESMAMGVRGGAGDAGGAAATPDRAIAGLHGSITTLIDAGDRLAALIAAETAAATPEPMPPALRPDPTESAEQLSLAAERVSRLAAQLETVRAGAAQRARLAAELERTRAVAAADLERMRAAAAAEIERMHAAAAAERTRLESRLADLDAQLEALRPKPPTARAELERFIRQNAVFFANGTDYRDPAAAAATIGEAARLVLAAGVLVRVVGYTDETGGQTRNQPLSQSRADKVTEELARHGVPRGRLVSVGRATSIDLSPRTGASSTNRRVELEIGFTGEGGAP